MIKLLNMLDQEIKKLLKNSLNNINNFHNIQYNFHKNFSIKVGQGKLPGNRERVISSGNLQFVDRSRVNSRFNIDRDFGITLMNHHTISGDFIMKEVFSLSQGEGRNITAGNLGGGFDYTFRAEFLPWGNFKSKGDYSGSDLKREPKPKLAIGVTYDINDNAVRERGQNGSFIFDEVEMTRNYLGKTLQTIFIDAMFKYKGFSLMGEFADAFELLIEHLKNVTGSERDKTRERVLELFEIAGPTDPAVVKARIALTNALF